jgi:hypothetical protein
MDILVYVHFTYYIRHSCKRLWKTWGVYGILYLALSKGPNRVGYLLPSPEDGNRSNFRKAVCSSYFSFLRHEISTQTCANGKKITATELASPDTSMTPIILTQAPFFRLSSISRSLMLELYFEQVMTANLLARKYSVFATTLSII